MTDVAFDLLSRMLEVDPSKRITAEEALRHPFFSEEPVKCEPRDLPKIERDSHEFQSRQNKKQMQQNRPMQQPMQNNPPHEMMVARQPYNNPNYYNKTSHETKIKFEETSKVVATTSTSTVTTTQQCSFGGFGVSSRLESLIPSTKTENANMLSTKRHMESTLESENINFKKQKFSPTN